MPIPLLIAFVLFAGFVFVRRLRRQRKNWLRSLSLPGSWRMEQLTSEPEQVPQVQKLELRGKYNDGEYQIIAREGLHGVALESGRWTLEGDRFRLHPAGGTLRLFELRLLEPRLVGLRSLETKDAFYLHRDQDNVVSLDRARGNKYHGRTGD